MIDTTFYDLWGLDIDATSNTTDKMTYEVDFELTIPLKCIIGYFTKGRHEKFYQNPLYDGHFSWREEENKFIKNYINHSFNNSPNRKQRLFSYLHRLCYP
jgi:hypothetical protein